MGRRAHWRCGRTAAVLTPAPPRADAWCHQRVVLCKAALTPPRSDASPWHGVRAAAISCRQPPQTKSAAAQTAATRGVRIQPSCARAALVAKCTLPVMSGAKEGELNPCILLCPMI